ncbi:MAG TPA: asparagine synthetase B [Candidatus Acidoferrales bacterium]|nr:asparagine synthetase B [Candidatus Acidoferrales bacterium]
MGAIVGIVTNANSDPSGLAEEMLKALKHRGTVCRRLVIDGQGKLAVAIGCSCHPGAKPDIAGSSESIVAVNGSFYRRIFTRNAGYLLRQIHDTPVSNAIRRIECEIGGFSGLIAQRRLLTAFRDVNGLKPLYYARASGLTGFASERKALWRIGLDDTKPILPGYAYTLTSRGLSGKRVVQFQRPTERKMTLRHASAELYRLMVKSIKRITHFNGKIAVAFSGGLDSALTAAMAKKADVELGAVSVGLPGSPELSTVEEFAEELGLPIAVETFAADSLEEYIRRVIWLIEEPNLMKVSVAVPLHWAAMVAARRGCGLMLCGQGSDELYGGYYKYARTLDNKGRGALAAELYRSVIESSQVNYERDDQATSPFPIELRTPFADPDLIRFSLTIPMEFKVKEGNDLTRKWVLRNVAKMIGVPDDMVWRRKKAIQHGTGVENAIRKLGKSYGLTAGDFLEKTYEEVKGMESMP